MNRAILILLFCIGLLHSQAAEEPLIPAALNAVLSKIQPGMSISEVKAILAPAYPKVKGRLNSMEGVSGDFLYVLDETYALSVELINLKGKLLVHEERRFALYDMPAKRRLDLKVYYWEKQPDKKPSDK